MNRKWTISEIEYLENDEDIDLLPGYPDDDSYKYNYIPVYDVEWIETDSNYTMQRYNCIRIGSTTIIICC